MAARPKEYNQKESTFQKVDPLVNHKVPEDPEDRNIPMNSEESKSPEETEDRNIPEKSEDTVVPEEMEDSNIPEKSTDTIQIHQMQGMSLIIPVQIKNTTLSAIVDTAAEITILSSKVAENLGIKFKSSTKQRLLMTDQQAKMDAYKLMIYINGQNFTLDVYVASITDQLLLCFDFLRKNKAVIDLDEVCMCLGDVKIKATVRPSKVGNTFSISKVSLVKEVVLEPNSVNMLRSKLTMFQFPLVANQFPA